MIPSTYGDGFIFKLKHIEAFDLPEALAPKPKTGIFWVSSYVGKYPPISSVIQSNHCSNLYLWWNIIHKWIWSYAIWIVDHFNYISIKGNGIW